MKNLGITFDSDLSFSQHLSLVIRTCFRHIKDFSKIRKFLSQSDATSLANALVSSRLDYCNSLLYSISQTELKRLQRVQNIVCRIVSKLPRQASITGALKSLHWLPVQYRIQYKLHCLTFKVLHSGQPSYLGSYIRPYACAKSTRRSNPNLKHLEVPSYDNKIIKSRNHLSKAFCHAAPTLWNALPVQVRTAPTLNSFRHRLKTHMFSLAYPP